MFWIFFPTLSAPLSAQVVKRLWSYIRENNLQDPKNKQNIICDESLQALFRVDKINMFQMNKALSQHIWPLNVEDGIFLNKLWHTFILVSHRKEIFVYTIDMHHVTLIAFLKIWEGSSHIPASLQFWEW